ncbi:MAG: single-stranded DNA-binding protein [Muribaculaceae bacterium]|nr:single-stranded DNA-binding protein [Muribaculaceae bacterium]
MSVNKVILLGNVGNDPEVRYPEKDKPLALVSLATNEHSPKGMEITDWHKLVFFGDLARMVERYVKKGTLLYVEGRLKTREYEDRLKINRKVTEVHVHFFEILGRKQESN